MKWELERITAHQCANDPQSIIISIHVYTLPAQNHLDSRCKWDWDVCYVKPESFPYSRVTATISAIIRPHLHSARALIPHNYNGSVQVALRRECVVYFSAVHHAGRKPRKTHLYYENRWFPDGKEISWGKILREIRLRLFQFIFLFLLTFSTEQSRSRGLLLYAWLLEPTTISLNSMSSCSSCSSAVRRAVFEGLR